MAPKHSHIPSPSRSLNAHLHSDSSHSIRIGNVRVIEPGPSEPDYEQKMMEVVVNKVLSEECYQRNFGNRAPETLVGRDSDLFYWMLHKMLHGRIDCEKDTEDHIWSTLHDKYNMWLNSESMDACAFWFFLWQSPIWKSILLSNAPDENENKFNIVYMNTWCSCSTAQ